MHDLDLTGAAIAFDLDGTLVDTAPDLVATLNVIMGQEGLPPLPYNDARRMISHGAKALIVKGFTAAGQPLEADRAETLTDRFVAHYLNRIADESRPFPGAVDALEALRAAGARLSVCTNKRSKLSRALLNALDLAKYFEAIIGPDLARRPSPTHATSSPPSTVPAVTAAAPCSLATAKRISRRPGTPASLSSPSPSATRSSPALTSTPTR